MRNLKRALSLTLASVMLLGMMVIGTSAAAGYSDVDENDNVEAIEVLQTIEVMVGDDRGFGPDRPVTRNEMAVVMGKLLNLDYNYYASACPFTDVAEWAKGWVGACAANGIVSGRGEGIYDGEATVTAVEAASMMMRALGYFQYTEDYDDGFVLATVRQGSDIGIFNGVGSDGNTPMTRNQVAQMALNALRSNMVIFTGTPGIDVNGVKINYRAEYTPRTGTDAKYDSIEGLVTTIGGDNSQFYIQLGEQLYDGDLRLEGSKDVFGRPARYWEYDGQEIGTYAKKELLRKEYTTKVTGRDLYDQLGSTLINGRGWTLDVAIDGDDTDNTLLFDETSITRTNKDSVGGTEKGVLTQVYVDNTAKRAYVVIINTYLAIASEDYDSKNGEVDLDVYHLNNTGTTKNPEYIKADVNGISVTVEDEDIDVSDVVDGDMFLVTVADGKIQSMAAPEVLADSEISSFKRDSDVVSEGKTYEYADTAKYDVEVLEDYSQTNMKDSTFNIILDKYGYLIGLEENGAADQYVFLTGIDGKYSPITSRNADANIIHMDGTMETVTVNVKKSVPIVDGAIEEGGDWTDPADRNRDASQINTWCTYSVNSAGVYTLKEVAVAEATGWKTAQAKQDVGNGSGKVEIDKKNVTLANADNSGKVYGNDDTVYINVSLAAVKTTGVDDEGWFQIIDDVDSVTVGAKKASLEVVGLANGAGTNDGSTKAKATYPTNEIYTLYKNNGYIIGAVVIGEDTGLSKTYAYIHSDDVKRETYDKSKDEWTWVREAIVDGKIVDLREVGGGTDLSELEDMAQNNWYEVKTDADGNVTDATLIALDKATLADSPHTTTGSTAAANNKDYVFCVDYTNHIANSADYPKFVGKVDMVYQANKDNDSVILFQKGFTVPEDDTEDTIEYKNGTLYVNTDTIKGFDVSPDVKTVLCLSDGEGDDFDDVIDTYEGYKGLEKAIRDLDSNFTGDLSVVFEKGSATVIIFNDTTDVEEEEEESGPAKIVGDEDVDVSDPAAPTLDVNVYGGASVSTKAVKEYLEKTYGGTATQKNGLWSFGTEDNRYEGVAITQVQVYKTGTVKLVADATSSTNYPIGDFKVVKDIEYGADDAVVTYTVTYTGSSADTDDKIAITVTNSNMDTAVNHADATNDFSATKSWDVSMAINAKDAGETTITIKVTDVT